jgi:oligopeptide transport system ATP-binding protein
VASDLLGATRRPGETLLRVEGLVKHYPLRQGVVVRRQVGSVQAVDGVSFEVKSGETLGIVGESGCGKSTVARTLLRLEEPTAGAAYHRDRNIFDMSKKELRALRRDVQIVFQDPYASLNPRMTVRDIVSEAWEIHSDMVPKKQRREVLGSLLERVGLDPSMANRYPHQFSGGQRQRIGIARALALNPEVMILDEPVSALDVSVQAQVVNLLEELQDEFGFAFVFIAHDLAVVRHICDHVLVMYLGNVAEYGDEHEVYERPTHPYTQALLSSVPVADPALAARRKGRIVLSGDVPSPADPPSGCRFRTRCWKADQRCADEVPALENRGFGHPSACHYPELPQSAVISD